jgi:hypothetical protein
MLSEQVRAAIRAKNTEQLCEWLRAQIPRTSSRNPAVRELVDAIGEELNAKALSGDIAAPTTGQGIFSDSPAKGMLKILGYSVGDTQPISINTRQLILRYLVEGHLPAVGSNVHRGEWGQPGTKERFEKLVNTLWTLLNSRAHRTHERARREWQEDLEWLGESFPELGNVPTQI